MIEDKWITVTRKYIEHFIEDGPAGFIDDGSDIGQLGGYTRHGLRLQVLIDAAEGDFLIIKELFEK